MLSFGWATVNMAKLYVAREAPLLELAGSAPARTLFSKGCDYIWRPASPRHCSFITTSSCFSLCIQHGSWLACFRNGYACGFPGIMMLKTVVVGFPKVIRVSWLAQKRRSPQSPSGLSEGLHSCLMFRIRYITTNYVVIIMSQHGKSLPPGPRKTLWECTGGSGLGKGGHANLSFVLKSGRSLSHCLSREFESCLLFSFSFFF